MRWMGLACAAWARPSTGGFVTSNGSGTDFCCTAILVQPSIAPQNNKVNQPMCRSFRAMSRPMLYRVYRGGVCLRNSTPSPIFRRRFARFLKGKGEGKGTLS